MLIAVDFDGTIVEHEYPKIGRPIPFAIETLKMLQKDGHSIVLWTVREHEYLDDAVAYCRERGLEFYAINSNMPDIIPDGLQSRKISADLYIDDRGLGGLPEWGIIYQMIKSGKAHLPYEGQMADNFVVKKKKGFFARLFS